jgi:hypothetical protein
VSEYATTPPLDSRQLAMINLEGQISAARRRLSEAGRSTRLGATLANHVARLEGELRELTRRNNPTGVTDHDG